MYVTPPNPCGTRRVFDRETTPWKIFLLFPYRILQFSPYLKRNIKTIVICTRVYKVATNRCSELDVNYYRIRLRRRVTSTLACTCQRTRKHFGKIESAFFSRRVRPKCIKSASGIFGNKPVRNLRTFGARPRMIDAAATLSIIISIYYFWEKNRPI